MKTKKIIAIIIISISIIAVISYFIFDKKSQLNNMPNQNFEGRENFQEKNREMPELTEKEISTITEFFESNSTSSEIENYCQEHVNYCMYYCREIDSKSEYCKEFIPRDMENKAPFETQSSN